MGERKSIFLVFLLIALSLVACGPSQAEIEAQAQTIAANMFATQLAAVPTLTPTFTPTLTPTFPPTETPTITPTPTLTPTPFSMPEGWLDHAASGFHIALPERWEIVDVEKEGTDAILKKLKGINTEWARNSVTMFTAETVQETIKFWAMDSQPAGIGYAMVNVVFDPEFLPLKPEDLCTLLPSLYDQMGIELMDSECGLKINGLDAARFTVLLRIGPLAIREYQYAFVHKDGTYMLTLSVDNTKWTEYKPIFIDIAETFRIE